MALCMAMQEKALHASSPQAPYVSTASGMHCEPSSEHFGHFVDSAAYIIISQNSGSVQSMSGQLLLPQKPSHL